jgi:diguanylate cyclase (GGDEF)-like protein
MDYMSTPATPRVQIIDPDVAFREALASHLRSRGYGVETCGNCEDGMAQAARANFDLILIENALPETTALTVLPTLQACQSKPCILVMAQDPETALVRTALKAGAFDFLIKPLELTQIEKSVAAGLENRNAFLKLYYLSRALQEANQRLSEQKRLLETERGHLQACVRELRVLNAFSNAICSTLNTREIILLVNTELVKVMHYDLCTLTLFHAPHLHMYFHTTRPIAPWLIHKLIEDFVTASPQLLGRQATRDEITYEVVGGIGGGEQPDATHCFLTSPGYATAHLTVARETFGLIELYRFSHERFTAAQERMLVTLAKQVSLALRNAYEYRKTQELTLHDGLTGLYNHTAFQDFLDREFEAFRRYNRHLSLLMFDIDHFKAINDTYGHQTGDFILQELATLSLASVRKSDLLARYGGEEFALILPDTDLARAQSLAERLRRKVQDYRFIHHNAVISMTISLGVASTGTPDVTCKEDLMRTADAALYRAKGAGRNRYVVARGGQLFHCPQDDLPL